MAWKQRLLALALLMLGSTLTLLFSHVLHTNRLQAPNQRQQQGYPPILTGRRRDADISELDHKQARAQYHAAMQQFDREAGVQIDVETGAGLQLPAKPAPAKQAPAKQAPVKPAPVKQAPVPVKDGQLARPVAKDVLPQHHPRSDPTPPQPPPTYPRGTINVHYWLDLASPSLADLKRHPHFPRRPHHVGTFVQLQRRYYADNYAQRVVGYLHPPASGPYQ